MRKLSVIILQYNTPEHVQNNLEKLQEANLPENTEIIVVNNGGNQANEKIDQQIYKDLDVSFYEMPNDGFPAGNNFGLSKADPNSEYYAFLNPDIQVRKDTLSKILNYMDSKPEVGLVSPQLIYADGTVQDNYRVFPKILDLIIKRIPFLRKRFPNRMREYLMWDRNPDNTEAIDWVTGAFTVLRNKCMKAVGKHDDDHFFLFMSDVVLCRDTWENGFEVHILGEAKALHNDARLSSGGIKDVFQKMLVRLHIKDSIAYFKHYCCKALPKNAPSRKRAERRRELLMTAKKLTRNKLTLTSFKSKLQKNNPVVQVFVGKIQGKINYKQPIIFFGESSISVVKNEDGKYGLIKIWRHVPLQLHRNNAFPIMPDVGDLGIYSYETVRGGTDGNEPAREAALRELSEEIGLQESDILSVASRGYAIGNTAIDIFKHEVFEVRVKNSFKASKYDENDGIIDFQFFTKDEIRDMIAKKEIVCGLTQASLLQVILAD